jgi:SpoVK/Ycf46/Vps4 family AAA+-type ATPase
MENSIQNIILQEMETLDGIMIATTNLTQNLDSAFERRFLYKIKFEKPDAEVRQKIWKMMMPSLSDADAHVLATGYDFSGGQIENVSRKATINAILNGEDSNDLARLTSYCNSEQLEGVNITRKIGF